MIEVRDLVKVFDTRGQVVRAVDNVTTQVAKGEVLVVIGPSGSGKSTFLRCLNGLEEFDSGSVSIDGLQLADPKTDVNAYRREVGMVFQHFNLFPHMTVLENLCLAQKVVRKRGKQEREAKALALLEKVGIAQKANEFPSRLSGGQQQRVAIARALAMDPKVMLFDEPTSALDPETTQSILGLLREINRRLGLTIVLITHEMAVIREICDRVVVLEHGRIVEQGPVWQVFGDPQHEVSKTLLAPLQQGLPPELQARLQDQPASAEAAVVLRVQFTGSAADEPDLAALFSALGGRVRLLHGGVERIQGHALGQLLLAVSGSAHGADALRQRAGRFAQQVEVLGYVV